MKKILFTILLLTSLNACSLPLVEPADTGTYVPYVWQDVGKSMTRLCHDPKPDLFSHLQGSHEECCFPFRS